MTPGSHGRVAGPGMLSRVTDPSASPEAAPRAAGARFATLVVGVAALAVAVLAGVAPDPDAVRDVATSAGPYAPLLVVVVAAVLMAALVPRTLLAAASGALFGIAEGAAYVLVAALLGAGVAFVVGRTLGRDFVRARGGRLDALLERRGVLGVVVVRLLPIAPYGLVSYAFGTTGVSRRAYVLGTAIAVAPGTVLWATLGATALDPTSPVFVASAAAAACLTVAGTLGARRAARSRPARIQV